MKVVTGKVAGIAGSTIILAGMGTSAMTAISTDNVPAYSQNAYMQAYGSSSDFVKVANPEGEFSFVQGEITPTDDISKAMNNASRYLCDSGFAATSSSVISDWEIEVKGAVERPCISNLEELSNKGKMRVGLGCSCAANPTNGRSSVNAEVTGVTIESIVEEAHLQSNVNTIVFTSSDGYEIALPLEYVTQRYSLVVYSVNGEDLCNSMGGTNQLWLGSTSARYFARDITTITFEVRESPPVAPGAEGSEINAPYVAITGSEAL